MTIKTVAIQSPGDMGHIVGQVLGDHGLRVITCLQRRSKRTRTLAQQAGISEVPDFRTVVNEADLILSIMVPAQAKRAAQVVADALTETQAQTIYVDCNAIAPETTRDIGQIINAAGGKFVDASIIGPPPRETGSTRFYASGPNADTFAQLNNFGLAIVVLGDEIGQASAIKMCYAALTKGLAALSAELLTAAKALGVSDALDQEFQLSQTILYERLQRGLPRVPMKSRRWVGEMEEIAKTFEQVGLTPQILAGAAEMYRFIGATSLADRNPEDPGPFPSLAETIASLADRLKLDKA